MRAFTTFVLVLSTFMASSSAQADAQDAGGAVPVAPEPLVPEAGAPPVDNGPPVVDPKTTTPPPDAKSDTKVPAPDARASEGCAVWPGALGGLAAYGGSAAVGGLLFCIGGLMASIPVESSSDNCAEACVEAAAAAFFVAIGIVIAVGGIIALGPLAAIAATIGAAVGSAGAQRKVWPSIVGGSVGILASLGGVALFIYGLDKSTSVPLVAGTSFRATEPGHSEMAGGLVLMAASGLVSMGLAVTADALLGGPDVP